MRTSAFIWSSFASFGFLVGACTLTYSLVLVGRTNFGQHTTPLGPDVLLYFHSAAILGTLASLVWRVLRRNRLTPSLILAVNILAIVVVGTLQFLGKIKHDSIIDFFSEFMP